MHNSQTNTAKPNAPLTGRSKRRLTHYIFYWQGFTPAIRNAFSQISPLEIRFGLSAGYKKGSLNQEVFIIAQKGRLYVK